MDCLPGLEHTAALRQRINLNRVLGVVVLIETLAITAGAQEHSMFDRDQLVRVAGSDSNCPGSVINPATGMEKPPFVVTLFQSTQVNNPPPEAPRIRPARIPNDNARIGATV